MPGAGAGASTSGRSVAVIGGGWAGLAAAIEATRRGNAVTLMEMSGQWGGRAREVTSSGGPTLDNGQHILIGAYSETLALIQEVGVDLSEAFLRTPLCIAGADGRGLMLGSGPPALAFFKAVMAHAGWQWREKLALLRTSTQWMAQRFECALPVTVAQLTAHLPSRIRDQLIDPLCVAALNTSAEHASGRVFLRVLRDALFNGKGSADLMLPRVNLGRLLPEPAAQWLLNRGANLQLRHRTATLAPAKGGWLVDGEYFQQVCLAASAPEAARLVRPVNPAWADMASELRYEPIITVFLRSQGARLPLPMLSLRSDTTCLPAQFVFDHGWLSGDDGLLAFVISGAQAWVDQGSDHTLAATLAQANASLAPFLRGALEPVRVLTEKRATFRCVPALVRPPSRIAPGLYAAGDYVAGPYPATLEGAVRSGLNAARGGGVDE